MPSRSDRSAPSRSAPSRSAPNGPPPDPSTPDRSTPDRATGAQPRFNPPRPPSTMPAAGTGDGGGDRHKLFVEIANLQMAKARQQRIRSALQSQADRREANIASIEQRIEGLYRQAGLEQADADSSEQSSGDEAGAARSDAPSDAPSDARSRGEGPEDEGFAYQY